MIDAAVSLPRLSARLGLALRPVRIAIPAWRLSPMGPGSDHGGAGLTRGEMEKLFSDMLPRRIYPKLTPWEREQQERAARIRAAIYS